MRKYLCCYLLILGVLLGCSGCTVGNDHRIIQEISNRLDTDIANGKIVINEDSHSGFLNDGTSIIAIQFSDDSFQNAVKGKRNWKSFPLDKTVQIASDSSISSMADYRLKRSKKKERIRRINLSRLSAGTNEILYICFSISILVTAISIVIG